MSRKRKAYSIAEKLKIVDRIRKGETQAKASKELGISDSTIRGWLKEEDRLRGASTTMEDCGKPRKRARHARDQQLEKAVCTWVNQARSEGMQISGPVIQAQARKMHQDLHGVAASFEASKGWLHRFKGRNSTSKAAIKVEHCHKEIDSVKNPLNTQEPIMSISELRLTKPAPEWSGTAVVNGEFKDIKLSDYRGKYVVFFFYPADFTFICPTEIIAYSERVEEFRAINCEVIAVSTDSHFSHLAWINTPRKQGGLGQMNIPLLADKTYDISKKYGVYKEDEGVSFRGLFIIDDKGNLRQITINDLPVGRNVDETLRLVQAFQFTDKHGEVCPANWKPGADTLKPDVKGSKSYFSKHF